MLPASSVPSSSNSQAMAYAYADPSPRIQPQPLIQQNSAVKPEATHTGWIIQVGALESESEHGSASKPRVARPMACSTRLIPSPNRWSPKATESCSGPRFAGLDHDQAEAACRTLKRNDISCITVRN